MPEHLIVLPSLQTSFQASTLSNLPWPEAKNITLSIDTVRFQSTTIIAALNFQQFIDSWRKPAPLTVFNHIFIYNSTSECLNIGKNSKKIVIHLASRASFVYLRSLCVKWRDLTQVSMSFMFVVSRQTETNIARCPREALSFSHSFI